MPRYFVIANVFLLVGLAALVWRVRFQPERSIAALVVLVLFVGVYDDFVHALDLRKKPGPRGAAAFLAAHRRPGDPVIACMPFYYFPLLHYSQDRSRYPPCPPPRNVCLSASLI